MHKNFYRPIVALDLFISDVKDKVDNMSEKNKRRLQTFANCLCVGSLTALATIDIANAAAPTFGIGKMIDDTITNTGGTILNGGKWVAYVTGVFGIGSGISKFVQMTKSQSQVTGKEAAGHLVGGAGLMALGAIADSAGSSFGSSATDTGADNSGTTSGWTKSGGGGGS